MTPSNYIETENPFGLAAPPASFLTDLAAYDSELRLFPSMQEPVYRLARRTNARTAFRRLPPGHRDNTVCLNHRIIPLKAIQGFHPAWGQIIISALASCDVQRVGGGVAASELLEQQEELEERRLDATIEDEADQRAGAAYRDMKAQLGSTSRPSNRPLGAGGTKNPFAPQAPKKHRRVYRPRDTGDHAIFVGR